MDDNLTAIINLSVYDGTRQLIAAGTSLLLTVRDGFQDVLLSQYEPGPDVAITELPFHDNLGDNYTVLASADGYRQAGYYPVAVSAQAAVTLRLMLVASNGTFHFARAQWADVQAKKQVLARVFAASVSAGSAQTVYEGLTESGPDKLACLLNISTAMEQISLPQGTPLDYVRALEVDDLRPDRFYCWADAALLTQVMEAAQHGEFEQQPDIDLALHSDPQYGPATSSFKQVQFGEANVQLTFHGQTTKTVDGVECLILEPDIDYYKDPLAHVLLEVLPNALTGSLTDPKVVYVLRWMAGEHAGIPEFDPLYTIE